MRIINNSEKILSRIDALDASSHRRKLRKRRRTGLKRHAERIGELHHRERIHRIEDARHRQREMHSLVFKIDTPLVS